MIQSEETPNKRSAAEEAAEQRSGSGLYDGFEAYRTPTETDYSRLLTDGLVVPDTNVFLNLYRYNEQTRNDLFAVLHGLGDRLWVPHQVMAEFWRNRESVLKDPRDTDKTARELATQRDGAIGTFRGWATRVGLPSQRSAEVTNVLSEAFRKVISDVRELAEDDASQFAADTAKDPVLAGLEPILLDRVGPRLNETEYKKALQEAHRRAEAKQPPGYKDWGKQGARPAGDYLIWAQILRESEQRRRDVLIVTGDVKEDWWRRENGQLRGPRPELAEEMRSAAGTRLFMLRPESLLLHARQILQVSVRDESVDDIERVAEAEVEAATRGRTMFLGDDDPMWALHSGGPRHEAPDWGPRDQQLAETQDQLPPLTAVFHQALVDHPGQLLSVEDLVRITDGALPNSRAIAGALSGYVNWCERLDRRFPFYWWEGHDGESTRYAMQPRVAALFSEARAAATDDTGDML